MNVKTIQWALNCFSFTQNVNPLSHKLFNAFLFGKIIKLLWISSQTCHHLQDPWSGLPSFFYCLNILITHYCTVSGDLQTQFTSTITSICIYSSVFRLITSSSNGGAIFLMQGNMACSVRNCFCVSRKSESTQGGAIFSQICEFSARFCEGQKCQSSNMGILTWNHMSHIPASWFNHQ